MEVNVAFSKDAEIAVDVLRPAEEDERILETLNDDKKGFPNVGGNCTCYSRRLVDTTKKNPDTRETNQILSEFSGRRRKTSPIPIDTTRSKENNSISTALQRSLPSSLPSHEDGLFQQKTRRKTLAFLFTSNSSLNHKPENNRENIKYTSLKSEIRKRSKTEQVSKNVNGLGQTTINHSETASNIKEKDTIRKDQKNLSAFGIHEEVYECFIGRWIITDLDLNVYEEKQAQDVTYLREKRKQNRFFTFFGLTGCCFIK